MSLEALLESGVALATLAAVGSTFAAVVVLAYLRSSVGAVLCLAVFVAGVLSPDDPLTSLAGIEVYPVDVVYFALAVVAVLRWLHIVGRGRLPLEHVVLALLAAVLLVNFVRGVLEHGPSAAGVEFRRYFFFVSGAAYFASFEPVQRRVDWLLRAWIVGSLVICVVSVQRFAAAIGSLDFTRLRVVDSNATLVLAQATLVCLYLWADSRQPRLYRNLALVLLPFVVIMQHRTVWVVMLAAVLVILVVESRLRNRLLTVLALGAVATAIGVLAIYGDRGSEVLSESATNTHTFEWRIEGWSVLLREQLAERWNVVFGRPMGAGFERYLPNQGYFVDVMPHNYYIEILLAAGVVGVLLLTFVYARISLRSLTLGSLPAERSTMARIGLVLVVSQLVYFITYAPLPEQSLLLGMALSLGLAPSRAQASQPVATVVGGNAARPRTRALTSDQLG